MSNPLSDMDKPDVIFCIGTNMTECHPVAATRIKKALKRGAKMIVADPRKIQLAEMADIYLPIRVGSDVALLLAMAHVIVRDDLHDHAFIEERTLDADQFLEHLSEFTPEWASTITEVPAADIEKAAKLYGAGDKGAIYYTLGITEHICGVDNVQSLCNLALLTGNLGREGTGINPMRGQNNIQGAGDVGAIPSNYPGFQKVDDPESKAKFEALYGREMDGERGITKVKALNLCGSELFAMLIDGETPSSPTPTANTASMRSAASTTSSSSTSSSPRPPRWLMSYSPPAPSPKPTESAPTPNGAYNGCARQCLRPAKPNPTGGSSANWPSAWVSRVLNTNRPKIFSTSYAVSRRFIQASTGTASTRANINGRYPKKAIQVRRSCTKMNLPTAVAYSNSCATATLLKLFQKLSPSG